MQMKNFIHYIQQTTLNAPKSFFPDMSFDSKNLNSINIHTNNLSNFMLTTTSSILNETSTSFAGLNQLQASGNETIYVELSFKNVLLALFLIGLGLLTIFGNVLVILAILVDFHLRSPTHYLMGSLALADLLLGLLVLPFSSVQLYFDRWFFGETFCEIWLSTDVLCCTASIYLVLVISIDRYIAITRPLKYNSIITKRRVYIIIVFAWIISLTISLAPLIGLKSPQNSNKICEVNENIFYALGSASLSFYIPLTVILIVYYRIFKEARAQIKFFKTGTKSLKSSDSTDITLRVHIGPSSSARLKQSCSCHNNQLNNHHDNDIANMKSRPLLSRINEIKSSETYSSISEHNKKNGRPILQAPKIINQKKKLFDKSISCDGTLDGITKHEMCQYCKNFYTNNFGAMSKHGNGTLIKNNFSGSSGILNFSNKLTKLKTEQKAAKTLAIVVGCLVLCWGPFFIILPVEAFCKTCQIPKIIFRIFFWLGYCNSAMNPLIYALSSREFRRAYHGILKCNLKYRHKKEKEKLLKITFKSTMSSNHNSYHNHSHH